MLNGEVRTMQTIAKASVSTDGTHQQVTLPDEFRFSTNEVYVIRDAHTGGITLSEQPPRPSMAEILKALDEAGAADFVLERDMRLPEDRDLF